MKHASWILLACLAGLAGCLGRPGGQPPLPTPGPPCALPTGTTTVLVYPAPNSTAIPDAFGQIVIGSTPSGLPSSWDVAVTTVLSPAGVAGGTVAPTAPPFPTPNATPAFANPVYQSSAFSGTFPAEAVNVFLNDTASNCTPLGPIGHFTTL